MLKRADLKERITDRIVNRSLYNGVAPFWCGEFWPANGRAGKQTAQNISRGKTNTSFTIRHLPISDEVEKAVMLMPEKEHVLRRYQASFDFLLESKPRFAFSSFFKSEEYESGRWSQAQLLINPVKGSLSQQSGHFWVLFEREKKKLSRDQNAYLREFIEDAELVSAIADTRPSFEISLTYRGWYATLKQVSQAGVLVFSPGFGYPFRPFQPFNNPSFVELIKRPFVNSSGKYGRELLGATLADMAWQGYKTCTVMDIENGWKRDVELGGVCSIQDGVRLTHMRKLSTASIVFDNTALNDEQRIFVVNGKRMEYKSRSLPEQLEALAEQAISVLIDHGDKNFFVDAGMYNGTPTVLFAGTLNNFDVSHSDRVALLHECAARSM